MACIPLREKESNDVILLNFTYPITLEQKKQLLRWFKLKGEADLTVRETGIPFNFNPSQGFCAQAKDAVDQMRLTKDDYEREQIVVNPPGHPAASIAVVLELQTRMGRTPQCVRLKRVSKIPRIYEIAEVMQFE